jgi:predicted nucleotidyltransferase
MQDRPTILVTLGRTNAMGHASIPAEEVRARLLRGGLRFVRTARHIGGVVRITLIGSLASPKQTPKDIDILVAVTDDSDLTSLAQAGRQLKGHTQSYNCGADIFLTNEQECYIGRICHWKECRPGIRASCDARHCGRRPFLHDDLDAVHLGDAVVHCPPVELWPYPHSRVTVPADIEQFLLRELRADAMATHRGAA